MDSARRIAARQRRRLLFALVAVSLIVAAAVTWVVVRSSRAEVRHATRTSIAAAVDQTEAHLEGFFRPINDLLRMSAEWLAAGELDLDDEDALSRHFAAVLDTTPVSSLMIADHDGGEFMLLHTADGYRSRQTRPTAWNGIARWKHWQGSRAQLRSWEDHLDYDARVRPWYKAAREAGGEHLAFTQPYTFFTTREPGVTGSVQFVRGGETYVVGFDILLNDISRLTGAIPLTAHGRVAVLSADGRVIGLPHDPRFEGAGLVESVLARPEAIGLPEVRDAVAAGAGADGEHFQFDSGGETWWGGLRKVDIGGQTFDIVVAVPERDVVGNVAGYRNQIVLLLVGGMAVAGVILFVFWRVIHRDLARAATETIKVGQYTLERQIGAGGMGIVYRARHALLRRPTAIKLLAATRARDPKAVARFKREVELTSRLTHPNTIAIYDFGFTTKGVFYYAMEYLNGADLRAVVSSDGPLPSARAAHILLQVCGSLAEAHAAGLIHRDIKPGNVIVCERGGVHDFVKVLDFGLVKNVDQTRANDSAGLTQEGAISGTAEYLSPEAINTPSRAGPPSDVYAVGALGYFLVTGGPPFTGKTLMDICIKHLKQAPAPLPPEVAPELASILLACLAKDPVDRPTAAAVVERLEASEVADGWTQRAAAAWWSERASLIRRDESGETAPQTIQVPLDTPSG